MIYLWLLLTLPHDKIICDIWTRELNRAAIVQACGVEVEEIADLRIDVYENGAKICDAPGGQILFIGEWCNLPKRYDAYRLRVVKPDHQELIGCTVKTSSAQTPAADDVHRQCPETINGYEIWTMSTLEPDPEPVLCMPPAIDQPASIATQKDLHLLAARLIWYGYARADCPGGLSGLDGPNAVTACGMTGARPEVIAWQNQLDDAILQAAAEWHVPAMTLKTLIEHETQFWTWTGTDGEQGLIQLTEDGAGNVLHVYERGYYQLTPVKQADTRAAWLRSLACDYCTPAQAIQKAREDMGKYAQALAAYYCMYGSWENALRNWNSSHDF